MTSAIAELDGLQDKWFQEGNHQAELLLLKSLPIFKVAFQPRQGSATAPQHFVDLLSKQRALAPEGTDPALLTEDYITASSEAEAEFLCKRLGVQQVNAAAFLEETVFSR